MKSKEYVRKYKLFLGPNFDHDSFVTDLTLDFMTLLEIGNSRDNIKGFNNAVNAIRMKWDGIDKKTMGQLPDSLWRYFYATVIVKCKSKFFPEEMERIKNEKADKERYRKQREEESKEWESFAWGFLADILKVSQIPSKEFDFLEISTTSTEAEIKKAYRKKAQLLHPDKPENRGKEELFKSLVEAKNKCISYIKNKIKI